MMWQRVVPEAVSNLKFNMKAAKVSEQHLSCRLCGVDGLELHNVETHLRSDTHVENLARAMTHLSPHEIQHVSGEQGPRVQNYQGQLGKVWFNHLTGESGVTDISGELYKWEMFDYGERGCYWYNKVTEQYFQVYGGRGIERGRWA